MCRITDIKEECRQHDEQAQERFQHRRPGNYVKIMLESIPGNASEPSRSFMEIILLLWTTALPHGPDMETESLGRVAAATVIQAGC